MEEDEWSDKYNAKWKKMNRKTIAIIKKWLNFSLYPYFKSEIDAPKLWDKLKESYKRKNMQNKYFLSGS